MSLEALLFAFLVYGAICAVLQMVTTDELNPLCLALPPVLAFCLIKGLRMRSYVRRNVSTKFEDTFSAWDGNATAGELLSSDLGILLGHEWQPNYDGAGAESDSVVTNLYVVENDGAIEPLLVFKDAYEQQWSLSNLLGDLNPDRIAGKWLVIWRCQNDAFSRWSYQDWKLKLAPDASTLRSWGVCRRSEPECNNTVASLA